MKRSAHCKAFAKKSASKEKYPEFEIVVSILKAAGDDEYVVLALKSHLATKERKHILSDTLTLDRDRVTFSSSVVTAAIFRPRSEWE